MWVVVVGKGVEYPVSLDSWLLPLSCSRLQNKLLSGWSPNLYRQTLNPKRGIRLVILKIKNPCLLLTICDIRQVT